MTLELAQKMEHLISILLLSVTKAYFNDGWMDFVDEDSREEKAAFVIAIECNEVNSNPKVILTTMIKFIPYSNVKTKK